MSLSHGETQNRQARGLRLLLFPCPFQGHITPMLNLATLLYSRGFSITMFHTCYNAPNPSNYSNFFSQKKKKNYSNFNFQPIPDGITRKTDIVDLLKTINANCEAPFRDRVAQMISDDEAEPIACMVIDALLYFAQAVADQLKVPIILLRTSSSMTFVVYAACPLLRAKGYLPIKDRQSKDPIPEFPPLRVKDLPYMDTERTDKMYQLVTQVMNSARSSSGLIFNSFDYLEQTALEMVQREFSIQIFPIGPLHLYSSASTGSLLKQDYSCMEWLEKQLPRSVIYVSFGSLAAIDNKELAETAWGLANSEQSFLWVVRPDAVHGSQTIQLPEGFEEKTRGRGKVVEWAPQQEVLAHHAVGGFWTHSGWNSTMESISEGVPMLCYPCFGDQMLTARYLSHAWRVGLQLENELERGEIEKAVRRLMVEKEGDEMRERIKDLKENAKLCTRKGGSSYESMKIRLKLIRIS